MQKRKGHCVDDSRRPGFPGSAELAQSMKRLDYKDRRLKIAQEWRDLAKQADKRAELSE